jgi:hypothetical protein
MRQFPVLKHAGIIPAPESMTVVTEPRLLRSGCFALVVSFLRRDRQRMRNYL